MKRKRVHLWALRGLEELRALGSITLCFALGSAAGCWCSAVLEQEGTEALRGWLTDYLTVSRSAGGGGRWLSVLWQMLRMPLMLTLLQYTVLGMLFIPLLMLARGFLLSFAVTGFVRAYAWRGLLCALLLFAPLGMVELSALFVLAMGGFLRADRLGREGGAAIAGGPSAVQIAVCWAALVLCAVGQVLLSRVVSAALEAVVGGV